MTDTIQEVEFSTLYQKGNTIVSKIKTNVTTFKDLILDLCQYYSDCCEKEAWGIPGTLSYTGVFDKTEIASLVVKRLQIEGIPVSFVYVYEIIPSKYKNYLHGNKSGYKSDEYENLKVKRTNDLSREELQKYISLKTDRVVGRKYDLDVEVKELEEAVIIAQQKNIPYAEWEIEEKLRKGKVEQKSELEQENNQEIQTEIDDSVLPFSSLISPTEDLVKKFKNLENNEYLKIRTIPLSEQAIESETTKRLRLFQKKIGDVIDKLLHYPPFFISKEFDQQTAESIDLWMAMLEPIVDDKFTHNIVDWIVKNINRIEGTKHGASQFKPIMTNLCMICSQNIDKNPNEYERMVYWPGQDGHKWRCIKDPSHVVGIWRPLTREQVAAKASEILYFCIDLINIYRICGI